MSETLKRYKRSVINLFEAPGSLLFQLFVRPLQNSTIIPSERLPDFLQNVFYNISELCDKHRHLLNELHETQMVEHPSINSISNSLLAAIFSARDIYVTYLTHCPISLHMVDTEMANNPSFREFVKVSRITALVTAYSYVF